MYVSRDPEFEVDTHVGAYITPDLATSYTPNSLIKKDKATSCPTT